ncbi:autophagy-related protein 18g-like isoform X1 [Asparagus officinalis]|uniref:autophagy-related protein 18g-like isoform X1 n=1 Tax=Asparagus officinalis TaxID=4686 RepID=UPI00098E2001|nr:autophagy-related protein 18g-like isoform X1 [Asparagus officinalis]
MRNEGQRPQGSGRNNGFMRSFSSYLRIVSNGASNVASTVKSAGVSVASSLADRDEDAARDQVDGGEGMSGDTVGNSLRGDLSVFDIDLKL